MSVYLYDWRNSAPCGAIGMFVCVVFWLVGSGRADDFVAYDSVFGAPKIDCFFVVLRRVFCCGKN